MRSRMGGLRESFKADKLRAVSGISKKIDSDLENNIIEWTTLFRRNWDIFAEFYLGIPLKPYQRQALHEIGVSDVYFWRAGRGGAKSFITMLAAVCKLLLYPNCQIIITSSTVDQANKMVKEKLEKELIKKLSKLLLLYYEKDWIKITKPNDGYYVECTLNNSSITVLAPVESARGSRSNFTIYDEVAIMKKTAIDQIFDGMLFPRQPNYLSNPAYSGNKRWIEESKSIYLTSSKFKFQWWYRLWCDCVTGYYVDKRTRYGIFATDFFDNIENGLKTWGDYRRAKRQNDDISFRTEYLNEAVGESEDSFFSLESFKENQVITDAFCPPKPIDLLVSSESDEDEKKEDEVRLIVSDFAWTTTGKKANESDNSIAICIRAKWKKDHFDKYVEYIELLPTADDADGCADRLKELFWLYKADYLVPDARSGGEAVMIALSKSYTNERYSAFINNHGLTMADKKEYHVARPDKLDYYRANAVDPNAYPCIIPIVGSETLNTSYWKATKMSLENNRIKFLIGMSDKQDAIVETGEYYKYTGEQTADILAPHGNTDLLISEAVNLTTIFKGENIKLEAPRTGHRDRIVTLAMGILICDYIENEWNRQSHVEEYDLDDVQLVW